MTEEQPNASATSEDFEFAALREAQKYRAALIRQFSAWLRGNVIEVGAGIGQLTELLRTLPEMGRLVSVEPEPRFCAKFRQSFPAQELIEGTIHNAPEAGPWHAILSVNVLEHILDDQAELGAYQALLRPQRGHLCLFVPARPEIYAPLDRDFGHHRRYRRSELRTKLEQAGFECVRLRYFNFVGYFAWWVSFCLLRKRGFDARAVRWFDRWIFPPTHWLESAVCAPPIGQSLLAVARARP